MKITDLQRSTLTTMQLRNEDGSELVDAKGKPVDIRITGHIKKSAAWRAAEAKHTHRNKPRSVQIGKNGVQTIQVPNDPNAYEKGIKLLAEVVTDITGIQGWEFSSDAVYELFSNEGSGWIADQWANHLTEVDEAFLSQKENAQPG